MATLADEKPAPAANKARANSQIVGAIMGNIKKVAAAATDTSAAIGAPKRCKIGTENGFMINTPPCKESKRSPNSASSRANLCLIKGMSAAQVPNRTPCNEKTQPIDLAVGCLEKVFKWTKIL